MVWLDQYLEKSFYLICRPSVFACQYSDLILKK